MKLLILISISVCWTALGFTQKTIIITSAADQQPVAYATIINLTHKHFANTLKDGRASILFEKGDSLIVSHIGFEAQSIVADADSLQRIILTPKHIRLSEVKLNSCIRSQTVIRQNLDADTGWRFRGVGGFCDTSAAQFAVKIKPGCTNAELRNLYVWLYNLKNVPKNQDKTPLLIYFYSIDSGSQLPGDPLTDKPIIYHPSKIGRQEIDVSGSKIIIPEEGIWIGFNFLRRPGEDYIRSLEDSLGYIQEQKCWGSYFDGVVTKGYRIAFYQWSTGKWRFPPAGLDENNPHSSIRFAFELAICSDQVSEADLNYLLPVRKTSKEQRSFYRE